MENAAGARGREVVLLTGASTGLGLAVARLLLARPEYHLVLSARRRSLGRFAEQGIVESERVWIRPLDVTSPAERQRVVEEIDARLGGVDALINNAGISYRSVLEHVSNEERRHQMLVNYDGPLALCRLVLPAMRRKRAGRIIQISSAGGFMAMPTMGIYAASKFALEGASEALYYEVRPFGVKISLVQPGFINSDGFERVLLSGASETAIDDPQDPYHAHYHFMSGFVARVMRSTPSRPRSVARTVVRTLRARHPKLRVMGTWDTHLLYLMRRALPQRVYHELLFRLLPGVRRWGEPGAPLPVVSEYPRPRPSFPPAAEYPSGVFEAPASSTVEGSSATEPRDVAE